jgi:hypothetical protein
MMLNKKKYEAMPQCKFNEGVSCDTQHKCACCGFEPHEYARRIMEIRRAAARGELRKERADNG